MALGLAVGLSGCLVDAGTETEVDAEESELAAAESAQLDDAEDAVPAARNQLLELELGAGLLTANTAPDTGGEVSGDPRPDPWDIGLTSEESETEKGAGDSQTGEQHGN
jgi:hypothetical protein